jgi:hypothetical protein
MNLNADSFLQIVQSLRSYRSNNGMREQRKHPRVGVRGRATIMVISKNGPRIVAVNVRDLSAAGIGLLIPEAAVARDEEFLLVLPQGAQHARRAMLCSAKRFSQLAENLYSIGAVFLREVPPEQIPIIGGAPRTAAVATPMSAVQSGLILSPAVAPGSANISQGVTEEILNAADAEVVSDLEARLRAM